MHIPSQLRIQHNLDSVAVEKDAYAARTVLNWFPCSDRGRVSLSCVSLGNLSVCGGRLFLDVIKGRSCQAPPKLVQCHLGKR